MDSSSITQIRKRQFALVRCSTWSVVFLLNLPIPLCAGLNTTLESARAGMFLAVGSLWLIGACLAGFFPSVGKSLSIGGAFVAVTQFIPILQLYAGFFAIRFWNVKVRNLSEQGFDNLPQETWLDGFAVTQLTGFILIFFALLIGYAIRLIQELRFAMAKEDEIGLPTTHQPDERESTYLCDKSRIGGIYMRNDLEY